jgi:hypothetical protein
MKSISPMFRWNALFFAGINGKGLDKLAKANYTIEDG